MPGLGWWGEGVKCILAVAFFSVFHHPSVNMIAVERWFSVILIVLIFLSSETLGVDGFGESCPKGAIVDLTEASSDSAGFTDKSGNKFTRESTWIDNNGTTSGCLCDSKWCYPLCCDWELAVNASGCVADGRKLAINVTSPGASIHFLFDNPCDSMWEDFASRTSSAFTTLIDGSVLVGNYENRVHVGSYCFFRELNSSNLTVLTCGPVPKSSGLNTPVNISSLVCISCAILLMLGTFVVYSLVPELKNLQGWIVRSYLISYIGCMVLFTICSQLLPRADPRSGLLYVFAFTIATYYLGVACIMWLNVMSFDVWKKFRMFRSTPDVNIKKRQRATFVRYSIYAWGTPAVLVLICVGFWKLMVHLQSERTFTIVSSCLATGPIFAVFICNTYFYIQTAVKIRQCKKETAHMVDGASKHYQENQKWFSLYVKLFIIMGCPMIIWAPSAFWDEEILLLGIYIIEIVDSALIFLMFVWKEDVRSSIRKQFAGIMSRLNSNLRHDIPKQLRKMKMTSMRRDSEHSSTNIIV